MIRDNDGIRELSVVMRDNECFGELSVVIIVSKWLDHDNHKKMYVDENNMCTYYITLPVPTENLYILYICLGF